MDKNKCREDIIKSCSGKLKKYAKILTWESATWTKVQVNWSSDVVLYWARCKYRTKYNSCFHFFYEVHFTQDSRGWVLRFKAKEWKVQGPSSFYFIRWGMNKYQTYWRRNNRTYSYSFPILHIAPWERHLPYFSFYEKKMQTHHTSIHLGH